MPKLAANLGPDRDEILDGLAERIWTLRRLVRDRKLSQTEMAELAGVQLRTFQQYEQKNVVPGSDKIIQLYQSLNAMIPDRKLSPEWYFLGIGGPFESPDAGVGIENGIAATLVIAGDEIVAANAAAERLLGVGSGQLTGAAWRDTVQPSPDPLAGNGDTLAGAADEPRRIQINPPARKASLAVDLCGRWEERAGVTIAVVQLTEAQYSEEELALLAQLRKISSEDKRDLVEWLRGKAASEKLGLD